MVSSLRETLFDYISESKVTTLSEENGLKAYNQAYFWKSHTLSITMSTFEFNGKRLLERWTSRKHLQ